MGPGEGATMGAVPFRRANLLKATLLIVTGVLAACFVALAGTAEPVKAAFPGENGKIAFTSYRDGNDEIYTMNADGTDPKNLTSKAAFDATPSWSPGGKRIAFASFRKGSVNIYTVKADGTDQRRITRTASLDLYPAWSPDGKKIVFSSPRKAADYNLYRVNVGTGDQKRLTATPGFDSQPDWQPLVN
jgi:TolB protein